MWQLKNNKNEHMKKYFPLFFIIFLLVLGSSQKAYSQAVIKPNYKNAIGVKYAPFAVTYKNFFRARNRAFELLGDFNNGFRLTGLYEFHGDLNGAGNLKWYIGFGGHGGYYDRNDQSGVMLGADGVAGLDYKFLRAPINISLDWQPSFELITPGAEFQSGRGGLAVRFAF
jgi:hypothetical protein